MTGGCHGWSGTTALVVPSGNGLIASFIVAPCCFIGHPTHMGSIDVIYELNRQNPSDLPAFE
jgi:hypothetical protein